MNQATSPSLTEITPNVLFGRNEKQLEAWSKSLRHRFLLYGGAASGGKSFFLRWWCAFYLIFLFQNRGVKSAQVGLFCEDYPSLAERQVGKIESEFPPQLGKLLDNKKYHLHVQLAKEYGGGRILLRNLDDPSKYLSAEYAGAAVDELTRNPVDVFDFLFLRLRWPGVKHCPFIGATNPGGIGADWVRDFWVREPKRLPPEKVDLEHEFAFVQAKAADNPYIDESYQTQTLAHLPVAMRQKYAEGSWDTFEGQYFTEFDLECTFLDYDTFMRMWGQQYWQPIFISGDWGSTHHAYFAWHTFLTLPVDYEAGPEPIAANTRELRHALIQAERQGASPDSAVKTRDIPVTFREYLTSGLGEEGLAEEVARRTPQLERPRVKNIFLSPDAGFESELQRGFRMGSVFLRRQMPRCRPAYNERIDGWRLMHDKIRDRIVSKGLMYSGWIVCGRKDKDGKILETIGCPKLLEAIPWAVADEKKDGDVSKEGNSPLLDVLDGARYGVASYQWAEDKPAAERRKELIAGTPVEGPFRFMAQKKFDAEERTKDTPFYIGGLKSKRGKRHGRS